MDVNENPRQLLDNLRHAIDEALADSFGVLAAMSELEDAGFDPSFSVVIVAPEKREPPSVELVTLDEGLILTDSDTSFLKRFGIAGPKV